MNEYKWIFCSRHKRTYFKIRSRRQDNDLAESNEIINVRVTRNFTYLVIIKKLPGGILYIDNWDLICTYCFNLIDGSYTRKKRNPSRHDSSYSYTKPFILQETIGRTKYVRLLFYEIPGFREYIHTDIFTYRHTVITLRARDWF